MNANNSHLRFYALTRKKLGDNPIDVYRQLSEAWHDDAPSHSTVKRWFTEFNNGRTSLEDTERCGPPMSTRTEETVDQVSDLIQANCRLSTREIAETIGSDHMTVFHILTEELGKRCVCSVWVPHDLTEQQKANRVLSAIEEA